MNKKFKILHLDNLPGNAAEINQELMKWQFELESLVVNTREKFQKALSEFAPDIILAENTVPFFNAQEALGLYQAAGLQTPFILVIDSDKEDIAIEMIKSGAYDYVLKDRLKRLPVAIKNAFCEYRHKIDRQFLLNQLSTQEKQYRVFVEHGADTFVIFNADHKPAYVSPTIERVLGYTEKEALDLNYIEILHPDDWEIVGSKMAECMENPGIPIKSEAARIKHKNGSWRWLEATLTNLLHDPNINGIVDSFRDVTERRQAEIELRESRDELQTVFNASLDAIIIIDEAGKVIKWDANAEALFGWKQEEVLGTLLRDSIIPPDLREKHDRGMKHFLRTGEGPVLNKTIEVKALKKDNSELDISLSICQSRIKNKNQFIAFIRDISERKKADEKLKQSEYRYRQIVETAQEGIWLIDENDLTTFVNQKMADIFEYSPEEMLGKPIYYFMDEEGRQKAAELMEYRRQGVKGQGDFKYISKTGKEVWTNISANPIFSEDGIYQGALAMISDITEKKKLVDLLDKATTLARIGSYELDLQNRTVYWSAMTKEIHEVATDFIPDRDAMMNFYKSSNSGELLADAAKKAIEQSISFDLELPIITAKGNERWVKVTGEVEKKNGNAARLYGSFQDIDKLKKAELELLSVNEEKNQILESIGDAFFAVDKNGIITYWNNQAEKVLGVKRKNVLHKNLWKVYAKAVDTPLFTYYHKAIKENTAQHFEFQSDLVQIWLEVSVYPSVNGLSVFLRNITDRKLSEIQLRELNQNLQKYTNELVQSNKDLEQFSYIVSHNLRAPVANIKGLATIIAQDNLPPEVKEECLKGLLTSVQQLDNIITDLNNILQVKTKISEKKEAVNLLQLVHSIETSIHNLIQKESVLIQTDFSAAPEIFTLKSYLHSIFYNLILNSIKYHQPGIPPVIQIKSEKSEGTLLISFRDN